MVQRFCTSVAALSLALSACVVFPRAVMAIDLSRFYGHFNSKRSGKCRTVFTYESLRKIQFPLSRIFGSLLCISVGSNVSFLRFFHAQYLVAGSFEVHWETLKTSPYFSSLRSRRRRGVRTGQAPRCKSNVILYAHVDCNLYRIYCVDHCAV